MHNLPKSLGNAGWGKFALLALGLCALGAQAAWYDNPSVKASVNTGYTNTYTYNINLSEDGQYLMVNLGASDDTKPVVLYRTEDLIAQYGAVSGLKYGVALGADLFGTVVDPSTTEDGRWKGGAISTTLGLMIPGNGAKSGALYTSLAIPAYSWRASENAFQLSGLTDRGIDAMDFNAAGTRLYANQYKVAELKVYDTSTLKTGHSLSCLKTITAIGATRIRGLNCYTIGGSDLVYYGEGTGGKSVFVYDSSDDSVTTLSVPEADGDIAVVKLSGTTTANPTMYVLVDSGKLLVYSLDATGKALASATPLKTFDATALKTLSGLADVSGATLEYSSFEVTDDGKIAFLMAHDKNGMTQGTTVGKLAVLATLNGGQMSTDSSGNKYFYGTAVDPYVQTATMDISTSSKDIYIGYTGTEGGLVVDGATVKATNMKFGASDSTRTATRSTTVVQNGAIKGGTTFEFSGNGTSDGSTKNTVLNTVYINEGGYMEGRLKIQDDPKTRLVYNGGYLQPWKTDAGTYDGLYNCYGAGSSAKSTHEIFATKGNNVWLKLTTDLSLASSANTSNGVQFHFTGPGGFRKTGSSKLVIGNPSVISMDYEGDTILEEGTVKMGGDNIFPFGTGKGKVVLSGATLDLNGKTFTANAVEYGSGSIVNNASSQATLVVGADGSDSDFAATLPDDITLVKRGAGTLTLKAKGPKNVQVEEGAIKLAEPATYKHWRFKVTEVAGLSAQCLVISEFKLLNFGTDVTRPYATVSRSGTGSDGAGFYWKTEAQTPAEAVDGDLGTKFTDHNGACDASAELKNQCWLQLDYTDKVSVSAYNWATGGDAYSGTESRNPKSWQLLGSDDGVNWTVVDTQTDYVWSGAAAKSWTPSAFTLGCGSLEDSTVVVSPGAQLVSASGAEVHLAGGTIAGDQDSATTLVKTGDDILNLRGQAPGAVEVAGGTLAVGAANFAHYRFKVTRAYGAQCDCMIISEFKLLDSGTDVTRIEGNKPTASRSGTGKDGSGWSWKGVSEGPECAVDGDFSTKFTDHNGANTIDSTYGDLRDECWLQLDYATPVRVTGYNWATGSDKYLISDSGCRNPKNWQLLGSEDGTNNWIVLDERTDYAWAGAQQSWTPDTFGATAGSVADSTLSVDAGATLDLSGCTSPVSSLKVDVAALSDGVGTICGGTFAASGTIALVNASGTKFRRGLDLRLAFTDSSVTASTFHNWTVTVDGVAVAQHVKVVDGVLTLGASGLLILIK